MARVRFIVVGVASLPLFACAQGGPPLLTDDTGTVPPGKWEVNFAWLSERSNGAWHHEFPILDFNYGVNPRLHVNFEVPWVFASESGTRASGIGNGAVGSKWRFLDASGTRPALSIHPAIEFGLSQHSARIGLVESGTSLAFPFDIQWTLPSCGVNAEIGFSASPGSRPSWISGLAVGTEVHEWEILAEVHGEGLVDGSESDWAAQLGFRRNLSDSSSLLFAFGRSITSHNDSGKTWMSYFAWQLRF